MQVRLSRKEPGNMAQRLWITGYRSYELGLFSETEPKYQVIDYALTKVITQAVEDGTTWVITGGQLGIEQMAAKAAVNLKADYPELNVALMTPFSHFGNQWKPENQEKLADLKSQVDFQAAVSEQDYTSPQQLRNYQSFMLTHTDGALLVYDVDNEGKSRYDYDAIMHWQEKHTYPLQQVDFDQLQEYAYEFQENSKKGFNLD